MTTDEELILRHLADLARTSERGSYFTFSRFLGLAERSALVSIARELPVPYTLFGGADEAERVIARFGSEEELGYSEPFPVTCLYISPKQEKFADRLTHRDFLGSILALGIERDSLGDIILRNNSAYLFILSEMADFVARELTTVKHTAVKCKVTDELPEGELYRTERRIVQLNSERLDATVAKLFSLSREDGQALVARGLVFVEGKMVDRPSYTPKAGERISVRGHGRFIYLGEVSTSRKGKLNIEVDLFV